MSGSQSRPQKLGSQEASSSRGPSAVSGGSSGAARDERAFGPVGDVVVRRRSAPEAGQTRYYVERVTDDKVLLEEDVLHRAVRWAIEHSDQEGQ